MLAVRGVVVDCCFQKLDGVTLGQLHIIKLGQLLPRGYGTYKSPLQYISRYDNP
jgi:hypothetical protein